MTANEYAVTGCEPVRRQNSITHTSNYTPRLTCSEVERLFGDAMRKAGVTTEAKIIADGDLHRVHVEGDKPLSRNGWFTLHADGIPAGAFGNWKTGMCATWRADLGRELSRDEQRQHLERMARIKRQRDEETKARHKAASDKAVKLWSEARQSDADHPYLVAKSVNAYGIRQLGGKLLVPLRDTDGHLHGLQWIAADGTKLFGAGTAKAGHYHAVGEAPGDVLAICEVCDGRNDSCSYGLACGGGNRRGEPEAGGTGTACEVSRRSAGDLCRQRPQHRRQPWTHQGTRGGCCSWWHRHCASVHRREAWL